MQHSARHAPFLSTFFEYSKNISREKLWTDKGAAELFSFHGGPQARKGFARKNLCLKAPLFSTLGRHRVTGNRQPGRPFLRNNVLVCFPEYLLNRYCRCVLFWV